MNHIKSWCLMFFSVCSIIFYYWLYFHVIIIFVRGLILTSGIRARFFFSYPLQESLTVEWESHDQVGAMADEGKLRVDRFNVQNF